MRTSAERLHESKARRETCESCRRESTDIDGGGREAEGVGARGGEDNRGRGWWKRGERRAATREQGEGRARTAGGESTDSNGGGDGWGSREEMQGERRKNENTSDFSRTRDSLHLMKRQ
jgi:hypothetical protein